MVDTTITITPATRWVSGAVNLTASAALWNAASVGRLVALKQLAPVRAASTLYAVGAIFQATYNGVVRVYRVVQAGTTAAASMAGTTPDFDLAAPWQGGNTVPDGTAVLKYLGQGAMVWGWGKITAYTDSTHVTATVDPHGPFADTTATLQWKMGEFSDERGWPTCGAFHLGRLWLGGNATKPMTWWASMFGDYENMSPTEPDGTVLDTDGITYTLDADELARIRWMVSVEKGLAIGSSAGAYMVRPTNQNAGMSPTNVKAPPASGRRAAANTAPVPVDGEIVYVEDGGRAVRMLQYDAVAERFIAADLTAIADDIAGPGIVETAYIARPNGIWIGRRSDGKLAMLTLDPEEKVRAWCIVQASGTNAVIESIAVAASPDGTEDDLYLSVARTINGATLRSMEVMPRPFDAGRDGATDFHVVDCGLVYAGTPATTFSGLGHLEGETVQIVADGSRRQDQTVASSAVVATGPAAGDVHIGLPVVAIIEPLPPERNTFARQGTPTGQLKTSTHLVLILDGSFGGRLGDPDRSEWEPIRTRPANATLGAAPELFTGKQRVRVPPAWSRDGRLQIVHDEPFPFGLLGFTRDTDVSG